MKKIALPILLMCSALAWAGKQSNLADYPINIHVTAARLTDMSELRLNVVIDGKSYELQGITTVSLLALGDYKAKLVKDEHRTTYDSYRVYEFLFPDGKTRQYHLVGISE
jgi:hypothetical protein